MKANNFESLPLVIDLDGTLIMSDLLLETGLAFAKDNPLRIPFPIGWLFQGKAKLKQELARSTSIDVATLPYNHAVIELINSAKNNGQPVVLATASHVSLAEKVATHLGCFDQVMATQGDCNLNASKKRDALVQSFGSKGFDYAGNSHDDLPVWEAARKAYLFNPDQGVEKKANRLGNTYSVSSSPVANLRDWAKALRLHQWMKNFLVFIPLLASHQIYNPHLLFQGFLAFLFFGLCASSVYILNDLLDLTDDRHHVSKRKRAFASGLIPIRTGLALFPCLLITSFIGAALTLPLAFCAALGCYYLLTLAYSLSLKRHMALDVITLAILYTMRIIAGTFALGLDLTFWMLAFSTFMFLSLALVKRFAELKDARQKGNTEKARGRGYYPSDLEMISSLGAASGYLAIMVLALYIHDEQTTSLYQYPQIIWLACPMLLFWMTRIWMLTHRGHMHEDPVVFAIKDRVSMVTGILLAAVFWLAT
jgi:4-hydroxybenzoate polyprenyltransferase